MWPTFAGLGAAALVALLLCPVPPGIPFRVLRGPLTPDRALGSTIIYLAAIAMTCAGCVRLAERRGSGQTNSRVLSLSSIAIWFAPVAMFALCGAPLIAATAALVAASLLWLEREPSPPDLAYAGEMFSLPHSVRLMRQLPLSIGLALLAEMIALVIWDEPLLAVLLALATLALFWRARNWHRRRLKLSALTTAIAVMLTTAGVFRFVTFGGGSSGSATSKARKADSEARPATQSVNGNGLDGWAGVILIPDVKQQKHVILVPPLPSMNKDIFTKPDDNPLTIPFYGVYWFYRFPAVRPPPQSPTLHGTPEDIRFRSQGLVPLRMEAHQNLGKLINMNCCARIDVEIHNAEGASRQEPGFVQLILADSTRPSLAPTSLAAQPVDGSEHQTLRFPMRPEGSLRQFDELNVRILRGNRQAQLSARISVERFVLVPRGR